MNAGTAAKIRLDHAHMHHLLRQMIRIRHFEAKCVELYQAQKILGFLHLYDGEEAVSVGVMEALASEDAVVATYREHGQAIARGIGMARLMAEMHGKLEGCCRGRGGSMHIFDRETNMYGGHAIVGGHMPVAVGLGLANKKLGKDAVTMCVFGDGGVAEGEFHEALNLSSLWKTPVLWFCENNGYGMGLPLSKSIANDIYKLAEAYRMPSIRVDGMDVIAVYQATQAAIEHIRAGNGPYFIEAMTYRYRGHSMADAELYRTKEEVVEFRRNDPIERLKRRMIEAGMLDDAGYDALVERVEQEVAEIIDWADASPQPEISTLFDDVYRE